MGKMAMVTNEWREMVVSLTLEGNRSDSITAEVYGCFALHLGMVGGEPHWIVTHAPTGFQATRYAWGSYTHDEVADIVKQVQGHEGEDWNTDAPAKAAKMFIGCSHLWLDPKCEGLEA
jgi:hypothetical protein